MTPEELEKATDLSSSIRKTKGLDGRANRGEGAKVASLPWNKQGMRYRSCHDGTVSETILFKEGTCYGRKRELTEDGDYATVWDVSDEYDEDELSIDWTEVTLFGNATGQDTTVDPYGTSASEKRFVATEIFRRFYSLPDYVEIKLSDEFHGRKSYMELRTMDRVIARWGSDPSKLQAEWVEAADGIKVEYVHLPILSGNNNVIGAHELPGQSPMIALVWRGEMYDVRFGSEWSRMAPSFGLFGVHGQMSIFIHLPDDFGVRDDRYRERLYDGKTGEMLEVSDFMEEVRTVRPKWVVDLVDAASKPKQVTDMKDVEKELSERLRKLRLKRLDLGSGNLVSTVGGSGHQTGQPVPKEPQEPVVIDPDAPRNPHSGGQQKSMGTKKKRKIKAARAPMRAPKIKWLDSEASLPEDMIGRAGKYDEPTNTLYLNQTYPSIAGTIKRIEVMQEGQGEPTKIRALIVGAVHTDMALHIGTAVVAALAKEGLQSWRREHIDRAFSPEALSVVADDSDHLPGYISRRLKKSAEFRAALVA